MKVLDKGHLYQLDNAPFDGQSQQLQFVNTEPGRETKGCTTQELLRMLIDRTYYCNDCLPWSGNLQIIQHLRMALALHEARAMIRGVEKGELLPEQLYVGVDGHFTWIRDNDNPPSDYAKVPEAKTETGSLNPGVCSHTFAKAA